MKRYLLFCGEKFYADGGAHDLTCSSDSVSELLSGVSKKIIENKHKRINQGAAHPAADKGTVKLSIDETLLREITWYYKKEKIGWWHIYDSKEEKIILGSDGQAYGAGELNREAVINGMNKTELL